MTTEEISFTSIPNTSTNLGGICLDIDGVAATVFRTPDGKIGVLVELPKGTKFDDYQNEQLNSKIRAGCESIADRVPDFYDVRHR